VTSSNSIYFSLREAAISAVDPASRAAPSIYDSANGHVTVTSQHSDLPLCQGMSVRPSGLLPSVRNKPTGSLVTGTPAEAKEQNSVRSSRSLYGVWLSCPELSCKRNYAARGHPLTSHSDNDVADKSPHPASGLLSLAPPHHPV